MKGLNKLALATAVAAAPFATQAMEPMSESEMGNTTGQAGVTIELDTQIGIDQIDYSQGSSTGSFLINGVDIGGIDGESEGLDLAVNIDLVEDGTDAGFTATNDQGEPIDGSGNVVQDPADAATTRTLNDGDALISVKNQANDGSEMVDVGVSVDDMGLGNAAGDQEATLITDLNLDMYLSKLDIIAKTQDLDGNTGNEGSLGVDVAFAIDDFEADFDVAAVDVRGMRMAGAGTLQALKDGDDVSAIDADGAVVSPAVVSMDIGSGSSLVEGDDTEALRISLSNFQSDIYMDEIGIGNQDADGNRASIGSVGISNLQVTNTEMAIYGRE